MNEVTFRQFVSDQGGKLPWRQAVRILLQSIERVQQMQADAALYVDVTPDEIKLEGDIASVTACGSAHPLRGWDAADCADPRVLPWEFWNPWSKRTDAAQIYPLAACLYFALCGTLPPTAEERLNGAKLEPLADQGVELPAALDAAVRKGLALNACDRDSTLAEFQATLASLEENKAAAGETASAVPVDLSKVRTVPAPRGPQAVYRPPEKKTTVRFGKAIPVAAVVCAFAVGLVAYQAMARTPSVPSQVVLSTSRAAASSSESVPASEPAASSEGAASSVASSEASSETASSDSASSAAASTSGEAPASSASAPASSSSAAASSKGTASSSSSRAGSEQAASSSTSKAASSASTSASPASGVAASSPASSASSAAASSNSAQTLTLEDGSRFVGTVEGTTRTGTLTTKDGDVYTGTFTNGLLEGKGTLKTASGTYEGSFSQGKASGSGTMTYSDGSVYTGSWADGQRSGSGTLKYTNGDSFKGSWTADQKDGSGTYTWANGTTYTGLWSAGRSLRGGTYTYTDAGVNEMLANGGKLTMLD